MTPTHIPRTGWLLFLFWLIINLCLVPKIQAADQPPSESTEQIQERGVTPKVAPFTVNERTQGTDRQQFTYRKVL